MSTIEDYELAAPAWQALQKLSRRERKRALEAIRWLMGAPEADGLVKRDAPFPHRPGTRYADIHGLHIVYAVRGNKLLVINVVVMPDE